MQVHWLSGGRRLLQGERSDFSSQAGGFDEDCAGRLASPSNMIRDSKKSVGWLLLLVYQETRHDSFDTSNYK